jgi:hypothetical protein
MMTGAARRGKGAAAGRDPKETDAKWCQQQTNLNAEEAEELKSFQAEADVIKR